MRVALIADIHGNLAALEAVLAAPERDRPDRVVCLGDVASTGPQPRETVERLRALGCPVVMGNADDELLHPETIALDQSGDEQARRIAELDRWCAAQLTPADREYLAAFRPTVELSLGGGATLLCCHGSPRSYNDSIRADTPVDELERLLAGVAATVVAGRHTHQQFLRRHGGVTVINPGSVGLNPPWAEYALVGWERGELSVEFRRLPLDGAAVARAALESGMPHAAWWAGHWR